MDLYNRVLPSYTKGREGWYHNIDHINQMLKKAAEYFDSNIPENLYRAILYHDIIYYPVNKTEHSNEYWSALHFVGEVGASVDRMFLCSEDIDHVKQMILATEHHFDGTVYTDQMTNILLDLDVMGFADRSYRNFLDVQNLIHEEYFQAGYGLIELLNGRLKFLRNIVDNKLLIYRTDLLGDKDQATNRAYYNINKLIDEYQQLYQSLTEEETYHGRCVP